MKMTIRILALSAFFLAACSNGSDPNPDPPAQPGLPPEASSLVFPENMSECTEGEILSSTESRITFQWAAGARSETFVLEVTDLSDNTQQRYNSTQPEATVTLTRGQPYAWSVVATNNQTTEEVRSATWRFYNAGEAILNYAPFPAELLVPASGKSVAPGPVTLVWSGSDIDGDITGYRVLLDTNPTPATEVGAPSEATLTLALTAPGLYYWQVITRDQAGNQSTSEVSEFKVE
ncbi:hypothetical protein OZ410_05775 [Robiginitalea sp. M366]|uniref:hypothetical protein n=1 Tax=Robiginitalea aestuariiviva TaxID=3036903 RepID=UPI00240D6A04|nr:hypothetical protein [Robiginitalea aestuariiviva]MDG1571816.1 hypothetical protein [Robiginitalea aestuariiviva]